MAHPMGEACKAALQVNLNLCFKLGHYGSDNSLDANIIPYRELDDALGLSEVDGELQSEMRAARLMGYHYAR